MTIIESRLEILKKYKAAADKIFGGPGSGPQGGGGGSTSDEDISSIQKIPPEKRTEAQVTKIFKTLPKKDLQNIKGRADRWLNTYKNKVGTPEHSRMLREQTVAGRILKEMK